MNTAAAADVDDEEVESGVGDRDFELKDITCKGQKEFFAGGFGPQVVTKDTPYGKLRVIFSK
jgi:hypothetical protein